MQTEVEADPVQATFSGEIDAGEPELPGDAFCEIVLWDWEGVHPGSGMADFTSDEFLIAVEEVDCPETGGSIAYEEVLSLAGPMGEASQVGLFANITRGGEMEEVGSPSNPISVDGSDTYSDVNFDLSDHPTPGSGGGDGGPIGEEWASLPTLLRCPAER